MLLNIYIFWKVKICNTWLKLYLVDKLLCILSFRKLNQSKGKMIPITSLTFLLVTYFSTNICQTEEQPHAVGLPQASHLGWGWNVVFNISSCYLTKHHSLRVYEPFTYPDIQQSIHYSRYGQLFEWLPLLFRVGGMFRSGTGHYKNFHLLYSIIQLPFSHSNIYLNKNIDNTNCQFFEQLQAMKDSKHNRCYLYYLK